MARARNIGNVYAELSVKDKMTVGLNRAEKSLAKFGNKLAKIGAGFALAAPAAAFAGLAASMKSAIDAGGKLSDMMARTGAGGEGLFIMQRAFENAGVAGDKVPSVLNKMQKAMAGVSEEGKRINTRVWSDLALSVDELRGMDAGAAFRKISESIAKIEDPAQRAAIAMEIFGRSGAELLVVMNDPKAFETAAQQVGGLGKTLAENADKLDKVSDSMQLFKTKALQVGAEIAVELLPHLESFAEWVNELDLGGATRDLIDMAKAMGSLAEKTADFVKESAFGQKMGFFGKAAEFGISALASLNPEKGTALAPQYLGAGGFDSDPMSAYNEGVMLPAQVEKAVMQIPELLKRRPELTRGMSWSDTGIPGLTAMQDMLALQAALPFMAREENQEQERTQAWESVSSEVNSMQARGLGMGAMGVPQEVKDQVSLLQQIRDVLKKASAEGAIIFAN